MIHAQIFKQTKKLYMHKKIVQIVPKQYKILCAQIVVDIYIFTYSQQSGVFFMGKGISIPLIRKRTIPKL